MKKEYIVYGILVLLGVGCQEIKKEGTVQTEVLNGDRPNIVFILADDLGYTDAGFAGSDLYQTPNLDRLAAEGMYFTKAHASHPTCQPSRISMITGKTPGRLGAISHGNLRAVTGNGIDIPQSEITYGTALQKAGYTTAHIGKWHIGHGDNRPINRGFDVDIASNRFCCPGSYFYPYRSDTHKNEKDEMAAVPDLDNYTQEDHLTEALSTEAAKFIAQQKNSDKPFFLNLWYYAVHTPIQGEEDKVGKYKKLITPKHRHDHATYAALIEHLDDGVGKVLSALEENNFLDNTIIVFMGDNGGELRNGITDNHPLNKGKGWLYEGGTRTPMLIKWPGVVAPGSVSHERVAGWDLYPTFLAMARAKGDAEHNKGLDGVDLTPLLKNPEFRFDDREFNWLKYISMIHYKPDLTERNWPGGSIIKGDWKLIEYFEMPVTGVKHHFKLFNLKDDPGERNNLAEIRPDKLKELRQAMLDWRKEIKADQYSIEKFYGKLP